MTPEDFDSHPLWAALSSTRESLQNANIEKSPDADYSNRIKFIASYILEFKSEYSELFTSQNLDLVNNTWASVFQNVPNYINTNNLQFLQTAFTYAEATLEYTATWSS